MANQFYGDETFGFEVIASGSFEDEGYLVTVRVIRLNREALTRYWAARTEGHLYGLETDILRLLGVDVDGGWPRGAHVAHIFAEIFGVVTMERITAGAVG